MANTYGSLFNSPGAAPAKPKGPPKPKNQSYVTGDPNTINGPLAQSVQSVLPLDPIFQAQLGGAQRTRDDQLAQFTSSRPRLLADYGYQATGYDSSGAPTGLAFDPNNPFSRAALMKRSFDQSKAGTTTTLAARGQHLSGAHARAQRSNEFNYQQGSDSLQKALTNALVDVASGERTANTSYETTAGLARGEALDRAKSNPLTQPPAPPANAGGNPYRPGTQEWAAYAKQHGQSWFQKAGQWYRVGASGKPIRVG